MSRYANTFKRTQQLFNTIGDIDCIHTIAVIESISSDGGDWHTLDLSGNHQLRGGAGVAGDGGLTGLVVGDGHSAVLINGGDGLVGGEGADIEGEKRRYPDIGE